MPAERDQIVGSLKSKGFRPKEGDHTFYILYKDGKKTSVFTKISHGSKYKEYSDSLLDLVKKQMGLTMLELRQFIDCELKYEEYIAKLKAQNRIK
ncbi:MAG: hypothetical protein HY088_05245 [Ignavibacteriales bacterium]|nr:hypothetical protein [Ignavibacteriales bacterium]